MTEMMLHAASRTAQALTGTFDWSIRHYQESKDEALDWMLDNYETVAGALDMIADVLDELSASVNRDGTITFTERGV